MKFVKLNLILSVLFLSGCSGYKLRNSTNHQLIEDGIQKIYVLPVTNDTYQAGIENVVYNALVKTLSERGEVKLVRNRYVADAVLIGRVTRADYRGSQDKVASNLEPTGRGPETFRVASLYEASLVCTFQLEKTRRKREEKRAPLWSASFSRQKSFEANNQLSVLGTTSALINDSEFARALNDLADSMMGDVYESLLARF